MHEGCILQRVHIHARQVRSACHRLIECWELPRHAVSHMQPFCLSDLNLTTQTAWNMTEPLHLGYPFRSASYSSRSKHHPLCLASAFAAPPAYCFSLILIAGRCPNIFLRELFSTGANSPVPGHTSLRKSTETVPVIGWWKCVCVRVRISEWVWQGSVWKMPKDVKTYVCA